MSASPNPLVGAVVVRGGRVVGEGFHRRAGGPHAEVVALRAAGSRARGADLYVTLEPCNHTGRTPPCVDAIRRAGVSRVVVALEDPNPTVAGGGIGKLAAAGVAVVRGGRARAGRARAQNEKFLTWALRRRPFVLLKWASTLDGRIASRDGESRWITGEKARRCALELREEYDAVLVGAGTVLADDPLLTRRLGRNLSPQRRIVLDGLLRAPARARLWRRPAGVIVATSERADPRRRARLAARGVEVWTFPSNASGRISVRALLRRLAAHGVTSLMVEGGGETHGGFFGAGVVDRVCAFLAPKILGGDDARPAVGGRGFRLRSAPGLAEIEIEQVGSDWMISGRVRSR